MQYGSVKSADGDLAHVDGDSRDLVLVVQPGSSRGGDDDAIYVAVVGGVEHCGRAGVDVDGEVVAAQQPVRAEARDLLPGVAPDVIGERHFQAPPGFSVDVDWGDLIG